MDNGRGLDDHQGKVIESGHGGAPRMVKPRRGDDYGLAAFAVLFVILPWVIGTWSILSKFYGWVTS